MNAPSSTVTVTGADRTRLLTDLTVRLGRIDVVGEREITLPDGRPGWELTVRHQPFVTDAGPGEAPAAGELGETVAFDVVGADAALRDAEAARADADAARAEALQLRDAVIAAQTEAEAARSETHALRAEIEELRTEIDRREAVLRKEATQERKRARAEVAEEAAGIIAAAQRDAADARARAEAELSGARTESREHLRDARTQAASLLQAARDEAERALADGHALGETIRGMTDRLRQMGTRLEGEVQQAHRTLADRASLSSVQARSKAESPDLEAIATQIAAQVVRILNEAASPPKS